MNRKKVAVFFGGKSTEHEVSVISGLQVLSAIDSTRYDAFPVYIDPTGSWWVGDDLKKRKTYPLNFQNLPDVRRAEPYICSGINDRRGRLKLPGSGKLFGKDRIMEFDIAFPVFHGSYGEDGCFQGLMEMAYVPYTGARVLGSAVFMDKSVSKAFFQNLGLPVLPSVTIYKPHTDFYDVKELTKDIQLEYPVIAKPCHLGSSIGVHKVNSYEELQSAVADIFRIDTQVLVEPFIPNLVEYNVAVSNASGEFSHSVIERPITSGEVLNFKDKYLSAGGDKDSKLSVTLTEGMVSSTREFNPKSLSDAGMKLIIETARIAFTALGGRGAPRFDFYSNRETGEIWLNEVNPIPGSYGYFLWEAAANPITFTEHTTNLIEEGFRVFEENNSIAFDAKSGKASLFG